VKQFPQLSQGGSFNLIDLKEYCIQQGIIRHKEPGSLDILLSKTTGKYLPKDSTLRKHEEWELKSINPQYLHYAVLDVFASKLIFEKVSEFPVLDSVKYNTAGGTQVALLVQEEGSIASYGRVSIEQPAVFNNIHVKTAYQN